MHKQKCYYDNISRFFGSSNFSTNKKIFIFDEKDLSLKDLRVGQRLKILKNPLIFTHKSRIILLVVVNGRLIINLLVRNLIIPTNFEEDPFEKCFDIAKQAPLSLQRNIVSMNPFSLMLIGGKSPMKAQHQAKHSSCLFPKQKYVHFPLTLRILAELWMTPILLINNLSALVFKKCISCFHDHCPYLRTIQRDFAVFSRHFSIFSSVYVSFVSTDSEKAYSTTSSHPKQSKTYPSYIILSNTPKALYKCLHHLQ